MDKKGIGNLDPKLREAYERVMGTKITPSVKPQTPAPQSPSQTLKSEEKAPPAATPNTASHPSQTLQPSAGISTSEHNQVISYNAKMGKKKEGKKQSSTIVLVGLGVLFLLLYTIVWSKIIGVKLPFLPF